MYSRLIFVVILFGYSNSLKVRQIRIDNHDVDTHADLVVERPIFSWTIDDEIVRGVHQVAYRLTLTKQLSFYSPLAKSSLIYDSNRILSNRSMNIWCDGILLESDSRYRYSIQYWSSTGAISDIAEGYFRTILFNPNDEFTGDWIGSRMINMNELRREFHIEKNVLSANVFMSGMGYGTLFVNGINVDPSRRLDPGWTTYSQRVLYVSYDISQFLRNQSLNCIGVQLGLGFYTHEQWGGGVPAPSAQVFGPPVRLLFQLNILFDDQTTMNLSSDTNWMGREGAHRKDSLYMGTFYDSRAQRSNWSMIHFTDPFSLWLNASLIESPLNNSTTGELTYQSMDPIRISPYALHIRTSASQTGYKPMPPGVIGGNLMDGGVFNATFIGDNLIYLFDVSQNIAGYCTLKIGGRSGMTVSTRHSEYLNSKGANGINYKGLNNYNYQIITAQDDFIIQGIEHEILEPKYTYHGFRYIAIYANYLNIQSVVCSALHSETTLIGNFTSSSVVLNQIQHNLLWSQLSNIMSIIADCSQRQERRGWLGDASLSVDVALFNFDLYGLYVNTLRNIHDVQHDDGSIPDTAPYSVGNSAADPSWAHAYPEITLRLYQHYNDTQIIRQHYVGIQKWIDYLTNRVDQSGIGQMYFFYGDWETPVGYPWTNSSLVSAFAYLTDIQTMITLSKIVGNQSNVDKYTRLYAQRANQFHLSFYNKTVNGYAEGYQTANVLALKLPKVVPDEIRPQVIKSLIDNLIANGNHSTSGIIGCAWLYPVLSDLGYHDLAVEVASQTTYPSFGYMFNNDVLNATTNWESFHSLLPGQPAQDSLNHHMLNSIGSWFYRYLAGIQLDGFHQDLIIHPRLTTRLTNIDAEVHSIAGSILVSWEILRDEHIVNYKLTIPNGLHCQMTFEPLHSSSQCLSIKENHRLVWNQMETKTKTNGIDWIRFHPTIANGIQMRIESGSYHWQVQWN